MACISYRGINPIPYMDSSLTISIYIQTYGGMVHLIPNELVRPYVNTNRMLLLKKKKMPDRSKVARRGNLMSQSHIRGLLY